MTSTAITIWRLNNYNDIKKKGREGPGNQEMIEFSNSVCVYISFGMHMTEFVMNLRT
jgi:hypothetical protein